MRGRTPDSFTPLLREIMRYVNEHGDDPREDRQWIAGLMHYWANRMYHKVLEEKHDSKLIEGDES